MDNLFAIALGRSIARLVDGLAVAYLPNGISEFDNKSFPLEFASEANRIRDEDPPFAVIVSDSPIILEEQNSEIRQVTEREEAKYRFDERLAVYIGNVTGLATFGGTHKKVMDKSFPLDSSPPVTLENIAPFIVDVVFEKCGIKNDGPDLRDRLSKHLATILRYTSQVHQQFGSGYEEWNSGWFKHVNSALSLLVDGINRSSKAVSLDDSLPSLLYAAFSLPVPDNGEDYSALKNPSAFVSAMKDYWSDSDTIQSSLKMISVRLAHLAGDETFEHPLTRLDWSTFDRTLGLVGGNQIGAFSSHEFGADGRVQAFQQLTEAQFKAPESTLDKSELIILNANGEDLSIGFYDSVAFIDADSISKSGDGANDLTLISTDVRVVIPFEGDLKPIQVEGSDLRIRVGAKDCVFNYRLELDDVFGLCAVGQFEAFLTGDDFSYVPKKLRLSLSIDIDDVLSGFVSPSANTSFVLLPPNGEGVFFSQEKGKAANKTVWAGTENYNSNGEPIIEDANQIYELENNKKTGLVIWSSLCDDPKLNGAKTTKIETRDNFWVSEFLPSGNDVIDIGQISVEVQLPTDVIEPISPVFAAIHKVNVSSKNLPSNLVRSVRGRFESHIAELVVKGDWSNGNFHYILPDAELVPFTSFSMTNDGAFVTAEKFVSSWGNYGFGKVPTELLNSEEAEGFRCAFEDLKLAERLKRSEGEESGTAIRWLSQTSLRYLNENKNLVDQYLQSYAALVQKAKNIGNELGIYWASYPFSVSVWEGFSNFGPKLKAVYLSPYHPIRLAWLSNVEIALFEAEYAEMLCGTIEGWNFPTVGPTNFGGGRLLAVPLDNAEEQIFIGWSVLIRSSVDDFSPLAAPYQIAGQEAPGSSSSGLNSGAVSSAIRDYRRINPHISTLTIDLAAVQESPRLADIDEAVLSEISKLTADSTETLEGGARIWDSINRKGSPPKEFMRQVTSTRSDIPINWSQYDPKLKGQKKFNIRILQDAGVSIMVKDGDAEPSGIAPSRPFRRFELPMGGSSSPEVIASSPLIANSVAQTPFINALNAIERAGSGSKLILSKILGSELTSSDSDWIITGEARVNPASLANLLEQSNSIETTLWEWRPPFLFSSEEKDSPNQLERRPYLSVVRIPKSLRSKINELIQTIVSTSPKTESIDVNSVTGKVFSVLGARGVGLSSLLPMGDTHAKGALGFYLSLEMISKIDLGDANLFVLPIDMSAKFLDALSGGSSENTQSKRADLLLIRITDSEVRLCPVEIKTYGIESDVPVNFKQPNSLKEPLDQLASSVADLQKLVDRWDASRAKSGSDFYLMANGLAALVEAAVKLNPQIQGNRVELLGRLRRIADGEVSMSVAKPALLFFQGRGTSEDGKSYEVRKGLVDNRDAGCGLHAQFMVDPAEVIAELNDSPNTVLNEWSETVKWAFGSGTESAVSRRVIEPDGDLVTPDEISREETEVAQPINESTNKNDSTVKSNSQPISPNRRDFLPSDKVNADSFDPDGVKFPVGEFIGTIGAREANYWPGNTALNQLNIGVLGDLGTGKTQLLKSLIYRLRNAEAKNQEHPITLLIFDYKGDFQGEDFLAAVGGVVLKPRNIPLNVFKIEGKFEKFNADKKVKAFIDILSKIYKGVGNVQQAHVRDVIHKLYDTKGADGPTFQEIRTAYANVVKDPDSVWKILDDLNYAEVFSENPEELQSFADLVKDRVLVVDLKSLGVDTQLKNMIVAIFLNQYYEYMLNLEKWPFKGDNPQIRVLNSYLLIDEAHEIMDYNFKTLELLLLQGREFGVGVILATQYLTHFYKGYDYAEPLRTWFIHKIPNISSKELHRLGLVSANDKDVQTIRTLANHHAYFSSLGTTGRQIRTYPFFEIMESKSE